MEGTRELDCWELFEKSGWTTVDDGRLIGGSVDARCEVVKEAHSLRVTFMCNVEPPWKRDFAFESSTHSYTHFAAMFADGAFGEYERFEAIKAQIKDRDAEELFKLAEYGFNHLDDLADEERFTYDEKDYGVADESEETETGDDSGYVGDSDQEDASGLCDDFDADDDFAGYPIDEEWRKEMESERAYWNEWTKMLPDGLIGLNVQLQLKRKRLCKENAEAAKSGDYNKMKAAVDAIGTVDHALGKVNELLRIAWELMPDIESLGIDFGVKGGSGGDSVENEVDENLV